MSFNGSGLFQINSTGQPVTPGQTIASSTHNALTADLASGLSNCICKDGQTTLTANLPMGNFKLTGMAAGSVRTDSATVSNIQDGTGIYVGTVGGTADVITLTVSPAITSYTAGKTFRFIASGTNTTAVTVNVSGLGAKAITKNGTTALASGDIPSGMMVTITYDGTRFIMDSLGSATALPLTGGTLTGDTTISVSDARTNTVDVPLTITSVTSGTPAAGIGTGILLQAESADENPSDFGRIEAAATDVTAGSEDTYFQMLTRVAGAALTATYRWIATAAFKAIFTHANSADRTYTLPDATGTIPTVATQAEVNAMTSTTTALTPNTNQLVLGTMQASTSGTSIDFTGIPAGVRRITVMLNGISTNGTSDYMLQIGDSGGLEATGYLGSAGSSGPSELAFTTGFGISNAASAAQVLHGAGTLTLMDSATNLWAWSGTFGRSDAGRVHFAGGSKALSATLDRVSVTTAGGVNTFDAGNINILYER